MRVPYMGVGWLVIKYHRLVYHFHPQTDPTGHTLQVLRRWLEGGALILRELVERHSSIPREHQMDLATMRKTALL